MLTISDTEGCTQIIKKISHAFHDIIHARHSTHAVYDSPHKTSITLWHNRHGRGALQSFSLFPAADTMCTAPAAPANMVSPHTHTRNSQKKNSHKISTMQPAFNTTIYFQLSGAYSAVHIGHWQT